MFRTIEEQNVRLGNALDVDIKITWFARCPNPSKDNEKRRKQVHFIEKGNHEWDNDKNKSDQKIYASIAQMSSNDEGTCGNYGDS